MKQIDSELKSKKLYSSDPAPILNGSYIQCLGHCWPQTILKVMAQIAKQVVCPLPLERLEKVVFIKFGHV